MVWLVEKKVIYHHLDLGFETVEIPVRVKFEFEVKEGVFIQDSLSKHILYNQQALQNRYPRMDVNSLESAIQKTVDDEIHAYMTRYGFLNPINTP